MSKNVKWSIGAGLAVVAVAGLLVLQSVCPSNGGGSTTAHLGAASARAAEPIGHIGTGKCAEAVEKAGGADKYAYAVFYREENDQLSKTRGLVESARKKISRKSEIVEINVADPTEQDIVAKYGMNRAPMPLVLVLAPNGAIMGGFPAARLMDDAALVNAVGCKASEQTLKALQQKSMVALCVQNRKTSENDAAMRGVEDFVKDPKYGATTAVVTVDPSSADDAKFLAQLGVAPNAAIATTVFLAPPGSVVATFQGATPKDKIVAALQGAAQKCAPGGTCGGKPCGPTGGTAGAPPVKTSPLQVSAAPTTAAAAPSTMQGK